MQNNNLDSPQTSHSSLFGTGGIQPIFPISLQETVADYLKLASYQQKLGLWDELVETCQKILKLAPGNVQAYWHLTNAALVQEKVDEALVYFDKIFEIDTENLDPVLKEIIDYFLNEIRTLPNQENLDLNTPQPSPSFSPIYREIISKLYPQDPYLGFSPDPDTNYRIIGEVEGRSVFDYLICNLRPRLILEVGSWQGSSAIYMAELLEKYGVEDAVIVCVDTWLGSPEHWLNTFTELNWSYDNLRIVNGIPTIYQTFLSNVINTNLKHRILPFPQTSENAYTVFKALGIQFDLIYIDANHEYDLVKRDLNIGWELMTDQGMIFGDDYIVWEDVTKAVNDFVDERGLKAYVRSGKFIIVKPECYLEGIEVTDSVLRSPAEYPAS